MPFPFVGETAFSRCKVVRWSVVIDKIKKRGLITSSTFFLVSANTIAFIHEQKPTPYADVSVPLLFLNACLIFAEIIERTRIKLTLFILICLLFLSYAIGCTVFNVLILLAKLVILFVINKNIWDIFMLLLKLQQKVCQSERNFV